MIKIKISIRFYCTEMAGLSTLVSFSLFTFSFFTFLAAAGGGKWVYNNIIIIAIPDAGVAGELVISEIVKR